MAPRLQLQTLLESIVGPEGKVYFQAPSGHQMVYPAIVYKRDLRQTIFANNEPYRNTKRYMVTVIDADPDSDIPDKVAALPKCKFVRHFAVGHLNHDIFNLYF